MPNTDRPLGIYVHVPFCARKCAYCDFYSITDTELMREYTVAVVNHIRSKKRLLRNYKVDTIFFGGGTPSILPAEYIGMILETIYKVCDVSENPEISIEANPGTVDSGKLAAYREMGINRLSFGLQSADNGELAALSRIHTREEFEYSYMLARMEGFDNINVDIMYALPNQTKQMVAETIDYVVSIRPEHISFYGLTIEPQTPFGRMPNIKDMMPSEDDQAEIYESSCKKLESLGYSQYEISNFARQMPTSDKEKKSYYMCRHNRKYWRNKEYIGFGPAAASYVENTEYEYVRDIEKYISNVDNEENIRVLKDEQGHTEHVLSHDERETRYLMVGFRLREGIHLEDYKKYFGDDFDRKYLAKIEFYIKNKLMVKTGTGYRLTRKGILVSNTVLSDILEFDHDDTGEVPRMSSSQAEDREESEAGELAGEGRK